ncbi:MAG: GPW/gp25 family protein [Roseiflexaceae bacterium]|nr:GPW/gp25 family protein [Roseiflexaceae bacterium]
MQVAYPLQIDQRGRVAEASEDAHIAHLIEQVLFTMPGERVNRPSFGSSLMQLVFAPSSDELATAVEYMVQGALQQWLGDLIHVEDLRIEHEEATITVSIQYIVRRTRQRQLAQFQRGIEQ